MSVSVFIFDLGSGLKLRINGKTGKSNGSILLKTVDGVFECVECKQQFYHRFTGDRFCDGMIFDAPTEKAQKKAIALCKEENARPVIFKNLIESGKRSVSVAECGLLSTYHPIETNVIKASAWNATDRILELTTEKDVEKKTWDTFDTMKEHCNMMLFFHPVDFDEGVGAKRARS
jgi:hypothetical protein